jgi:hypothetical protein
MIFSCCIESSCAVDFFYRSIAEMSSKQRATFWPVVRDKDCEPFINRSEFCK